MDKNKRFEQLIQNREKELYRIAFSYMKNESDAMDCVQDSLIKAIEGFDSLRNKEHFDTWMVRIVINTCKDNLRKRKRFVPLANGSDTMADRLEDKDSLIDLFDSLDALTDEERELVYLRYFEGKKLKEISPEKSLKLGTVKSRLNRTMDKLRERMS